MNSTLAIELGTGNSLTYNRNGTSDNKTGATNYQNESSSNRVRFVIPRMVFSMGESGMNLISQIILKECARECTNGYVMKQ